MKKTWILLLVVFLSVYIYASFSGPVAQDDVINETLPLALEYNKTKEHDTRDIPIKGKIICCPLSFPDFEDFIYEPPSNPQHNKPDPELPESIRSKFGDSIPSELRAPPTFDNNTNITILFYTAERDYVDSWSTGSKVVLGYKLRVNVIVVYWPEKKVGGWASFSGDEPPDVYSAGISVPDAIYDDFPSDKIEKWIRSHYVSG